MLSTGASITPGATSRLAVGEIVQEVADVMGLGKSDAAPSRLASSGTISAGAGFQQEGAARCFP